MQEAARAAEEALEGHIIVTTQAGEALPEPSELDALDRDRDVDEAARMPVRGELPGKSVRLNITMDEGLVATIDRISGSRSRFLADAAKALAGTDETGRPFRATRAMVNSSNGAPPSRMQTSLTP